MFNLICCNNQANFLSFSETDKPTFCPVYFLSGNMYLFFGSWMSKLYTS